MSTAIETFLDQCLALVSPAAACVCFADRSFHHRTQPGWLTSVQMEKAVSHFTLALEGLRRRQIEPVRLCWVFEHARVFLSRRGDGAVLALFVENRPELDLQVFERALAEFALI